MNAGFDRIVLCGKSKRVLAGWIHDIVAFHAFLPRDDIHRGIRTNVAHMKTDARGVRKLDETIKFLFFGGELSLINLFFIPYSLPLLFYLLVVICLHILPSYPKLRSFAKRFFGSGNSSKVTSGTVTYLDMQDTCFDPALLSA